MSWVSTGLYYKYLNTGINEKKGGLSSARIIMDSHNFDEVIDIISQGNEESIVDLIGSSARRLEKAGANFILICTNTIHKFAEEIEKSISIPLINIVEVTARSIKEHGSRKVLLLGTRLTMEDGFFKNFLEENFDIDVVVPDQYDRNTINNIIFQELCHGITLKKSKKLFEDIIDKEIKNGVDGVVFGCTEIGTLITQDDIRVHAFDALKLHVDAALKLAIE